MRIKQNQLCMGSVLEISLYGESKTSRQILKAAFAEVGRLEALLSPFKTGSELSRVNRRAADGPVKADGELIDLIRRGIEFSRLSQGALDFTVGPLMGLWGFRDRFPCPLPPAPPQVQKALQRVGYQNVLLDVDSRTVQYQKAGMEIEFGALGKGYAIDRVVQVLKDHGVSNALLSFGSSTYALGHPPDQAGWRVAIRHPRAWEKVTEVVILRDCAISTSGDYEQAFRSKGRRYGHILDPRTGYPSAGPASVSVIAPSAIEADAFSTTAFVLGGASGLSFLERQEGVEGMMVRESATGNLFTTRTGGWKAFCPEPRSRPLLARRRFLGALLGMMGWLIVGPSLGHAIVYRTREEALRSLLPQAQRFRKEEVVFTQRQKEQVQDLLGNKIREKTYTFWRGEGNKKPEGYAVILNVIGKERPISFMVGVSPQGKVLGVEVLIYRESQGSEIRSGRFMEQFVGKTLDSPLKLGRDIDSISGATLSSRSAAYAVKKALALVQVIYIRRGSELP